MGARLLCFPVLCVVALGWSQAQTWTEDFESYPDAMVLSDVSGWDAWDDVVSAAGTVSTTHARSGTKSILIDPGTDAIHPFFAATCGVWTLSAWQYIESGGLAPGDAVFLVQNIYNHLGPYEWTVELPCNGASNTITDSYRGGSAVPLVYDQWIEIRLEIDLDADTIDQYYNSTLIASGIYTTRGGPVEIDNLDLWSNNGTCWYDDVSLTAISGQEEVQTSAITFSMGAPEPGDLVDILVEIENLSSAALGPVRVDLFLDPGVVPGGDSTAAKMTSPLFDDTLMLAAGPGTTATATFAGQQSLSEDLWRVYAMVNADEAVCGDEITNNVAGPVLLAWTTAIAVGPCGDCDLNGVVSILDALVSSQMAAGLLTPTAAHFLVCDVDLTQTITILDALLMAQAAAALPVTLSCTPALRHLVEIHEPVVGGTFTIGPVSVLVDLWGEAGGLDAVAFDHSTDGGATFLPCTEAPGSPMAAGAPAVSGAGQEFLWDSDTDLPGRPVTGVVLRVTTTLGGSTREATVTGLDFN